MQIVRPRALCLTRCPYSRAKRPSISPLRQPWQRTTPVSHRPRLNTHHGRVFLLDAALPFDHEHRETRNLHEAQKLKVGIVGFGTFGQFLAKRLVQAGYQVTATSKRDYTNEAQEMDVRFFPDANDFAEDHPEVVILSTSIISLESVVNVFPFHRLRRSTLVVDVLSVKVFPKRLLLAKLPAELDILCMHPMFGPDSGKGTWQGLPLMYDTVRIGTDVNRSERLHRLLQFFEEEGCAMLPMSCEEHDKKTASTQFITHTVGRILGAMELERTELDTKGFQSLLNLIDNTSNDSFDLYYGLFMYNQNATEEIDRLERAFEMVKKQLFNRLHVIARDRLFHFPVDEGSTAGQVDASVTESNGIKQQSKV